MINGRSEQRLDDGTRLIRWAAAEHDIPADVEAAPGRVTGLAMQWHRSLPDSCESVAIEILVPRKYATGHWLGCGVVLHPTTISPALTAVVESPRDREIKVEVDECPVDHDELWDRPLPLMDAVRAWHDAEHPDALRHCTHQVCRELLELGVPA